MQEVQRFDFNTCLFSADATSIISEAEKQAILMNANCVRTEHLVLGFIGNPQSSAGQLIAKEDVTTKAMLEHTARIRFHELPCGERLRAFLLPMSAEFRNVLLKAHSVSKAQNEAVISDYALLAGLLSEGCSTGMYCLRRVHPDLHALRESFRPYLGPARSAGPSRSELCDLSDSSAHAYVGETSSRLRPGVPCGRRARQVVDKAIEAAREHSVAWIGTAYLLFGLAAVPGSLASAALREAGAQPKNVKALIAELTPAESRYPDRLEAPHPTSELQALMDSAAELARRESSAEITPEHLLFAMLVARNSTAQEIMRRMHIDPEEIFDDIHRALD